MNPFAALARRLFGTAPPIAQQPAEVQPSAALLGEPKRRNLSISSDALGRAQAEAAGRKEAHPWKLPDVPPGVIPKGTSKLAMDDAMAPNYQWALNSAFQEGMEFFGYAYLAELTQRAEYRRPAEIVAKNMTREWIELTAKGEEDLTDKLEQIEKELKRLGVQDKFRQVAEQDGYFGRSQLYLDVGTCDPDDRDELMKPLTDTPAKIGKQRKGLKRLVVIEPIWTYPNQYNTIDPLAADYFKPQSWFIMGKEVHDSRLLTFVSKPVPDILKPAYAFGGLSLTQISKPYVDNWLRTRQSISDLVHSFSVMGIKTQLGTILSGGSDPGIFQRISLFNKMRDNRGTMIIDKDTEEFFNVSAPLGTLDALQAQSQEHMAAVNGIPLIVLFGITPTGLNASSEGELDVFEQWTASQQEALFTKNLTRIINLVQLTLFGVIDPNVGFKYKPLGVQNKLEEAQTRKTEAETDALLIEANIITNEEARKRVAADENTPYAGLDVDDVPQPPEEEPPAMGGFAGAELGKHAGEEETGVAPPTPAKSQLNEPKEQP